MDNFALLQEPRLPWLDPESLKVKFLALSAQVHPDKIPSSDEIGKAVATRHFAELNAAYNCLREPKTRLLHLLELEKGALPTDVQSIPGGAMELFLEVGQTCREADQFLATKAKASSPLLQVEMFEQSMEWTDKLNRLRQQIDLRRDELLAELKRMNTDWNAVRPLDRLEQVYRIFSYLARWSEQIQERAVRLSF